jgi:hypothetical protein
MPLGVVGPVIVELPIRRLAEVVWKDAPKSVRGAYAKTCRTPDWYPSNAGHEESCMNLGGPSPKAKYSHATDSELVP